MVWGPPRDIPGAIAVLREAIDSGVNHLDTSDFYCSGRALLDNANVCTERMSVIRKQST
jgi:aryl-alcohol dehydrogenase-like predicted oxidoreductase